MPKNKKFVAKDQKKLKRDHLETFKNCQKKPHSAEKNLKKDALVSSGIVSYANKGITIIVQLAGPNDTILPLKIL